MSVYVVNVDVEVEAEDEVTAEEQVTRALEDGELFYTFVDTKELI